MSDRFGSILDAMVGERGMTLSAMRVYARLIHVHGRGIYERGYPAKEWLLARDLGMKPATVRTALRLLTTLGYLTECGRGSNNVRIVQATPAPEGLPSAAA